MVGEEWVSRGRPSHTCKEEEWTLVFQGLLGRPKHVADRSYELCVGEKVRDITIKLWEKLRKLSSEAVRLSGPRWDVHEEDPILTATERQATSSPTMKFDAKVADTMMDSPGRHLTIAACIMFVAVRRDIHIGRS